MLRLGSVRLGLVRGHRLMCSQGSAARLQGSYKLVRFTTQLEGQEEQLSFGKPWIGALSYTGSRMMAVCSAEDLTPYTVAPPTGPMTGMIRGTAEECYSVAQDVLAYSGAFSVDEEACTVMHHVDVSVSPHS
eukprot:3833367-Prymnesium_polylepis.1